ncbi:MAG: hypothetical protein ACHQ49_18225 [Elusimicrobiota bacterium]
MTMFTSGFSRRCAALVLAVAMSSAALAKPAPEEKYALTLASDEAGLVAASQFSCHDKVFAFLRLPRAMTGKHALRAEWYRPDGELQETTKTAVDLGPTGQDRIYIWLQCHPARVEDAADVFFHSDDGSEFDGGWRLDVSWDGKKVADDHFTMVCP